MPVFALVAALAAQAADSARVKNRQPDEAAVCELHIWATSGMGTTLQTAKDNLDTASLGPFLGSSPRQRVEQDRAQVHTFGATSDDELDNESQLALLTAMPLPQMLGVPAYRLVIHSGPLDGRTLKTSQARYAESAAPCYADLVLSDVVYSREYARGQNLKSFFRFRDFGSQSTPHRRLATWVKTMLAVPREGKKIDIASSDAELPAALTENAKKFAEYLAKLP